MKLSQKVYKIIDTYFDDPENFKEMYPVPLIKELANTFYCKEEAGLKMLKQYYKERPTLRSFAYNYNDFIQYCKNYEKKLNKTKPTQKLMKKLFEQIQIPKENPEANDKLLFLLDYFHYKYFNRGDESLPDQSFTEEEFMMMEV
jgi:hypothetical protein